MRQVKRGLLAFVALQALSAVIGLFRGGTLTAYLDASFLVGLFALIISGFYYLSGQKAFAGTGASLKKFGYAIVELFSKTDHAEQRRALNKSAHMREDIRKDCEFIVASALILIVDFAIIYLIVGKL